MPLENKTISLSDGRELAYIEYGNKDGYPILYCHGSQSSKLEMHYDLRFAIDNDVRIIAIDRPGHGDSDFNPLGSISSFAQDVQSLLQKENIDEFSVLGMSAGAPFAMGIANYLSPKKLGIVSGFAPITTDSLKALNKQVRLLLSLAKTTPFILKAMLNIQQRQLEKNPRKALGNFLKIMSEPDQIELKNESIMQVIEKMFLEAFKNGSQGVAYEISKILVQDWGFTLNEIKVPTYMWHGEKDNNVPLEWAIHINRQMENSVLILFPNEGHLIIFKNAATIFSSLK